MLRCDMGLDLIRAVNGVRFFDGRGTTYVYCFSFAGIVQGMWDCVPTCDMELDLMRDVHGVRFFDVIGPTYYFNLGVESCVEKWYDIGWG